MEEINNQKNQLLSELEQVLIAANFEPNQVQSIVSMHENFSIEEIEESLDKYKRHQENYQETADLIKRNNDIVTEGVREFKEEATDAVHKILEKKAKEKGIDYKSPPNPYREPDDINQ